MPFAMPKILRECSDHSEECYFCMTATTKGINFKKKHIHYLNIYSDIWTALHSDVLRVPKLPVNFNLLIDQGYMKTCNHESEILRRNY